MNNKVKNITQESFDAALPENSNITNRMKLEGECTIEQIQFLKINYPKAILCTILLTCTFFGLLALKYFKKLRTIVWFTSSDFRQATHIYVKHDDDVDDIEPIIRENSEIFFHFKKLRYIYDKNVYYPVGFDYQDKFELFSNKKHLAKGLEEIVREAHLRQFGENKHPVEIQNYFEFLFEVLLKPFFILQYIVCVAFIVEKIQIFAYSILAFSLLTTTINYIIAYRGFLKIKAMAQKQYDVRVLRNGQFINAKNYQLIPGDIIDPSGEIPCDCIVLQGDIYVNEASLTGEDVPIAKFPATQKNQTQLDNRWLYEGAKVLEKKDDVVLALVINVGFATRRGRIIRKIRTKVSKIPQIFKRAMMFLGQTFIVSLIVYLATINITLSKQIDPLFVGFRFIDFLGWSVPPIYPIYFNLIYSFALIRLRNKNVIGIEPQKTVQASDIKTMCFDKTGTLTRNQVQVHDVYKIDENKNIAKITEYKHDKNNQLVLKLFSTCHTTKQINGQFLGDQVDLRMFLYSEYEMSMSEKEDVRFVVKQVSRNIVLQVLRINQFESKFQSMSVLVREPASGKIYAFAKGAPQKIHNGSITKIKGYDKKVASLSLGGLRTIGCGYRQIPESELKNYIDGPRDIYTENLQILCLVAFQNKLKNDTRQTLDRLVAADIQPKIITGDNIFIAIQTATTAGMIKRNDPVIIIQGKKQNIDDFIPGQPRTFKGIKLSRLQTETIEEQVTLTQNDTYLNEIHPIAIDNDFLKLDPMPALADGIRIFARISPQNKALIVQKEKQKVQSQYANRSICDKMFGKLRYKVGMCGDGANDLMAIRQADVGIGINDSDASYGATFTIVQMLDIDYIIRDSKATTANIIEIFRYFAIISIIKIPASILLITDTSYWNQLQILYFNFTSTVLYPFVQAFSGPQQTNTPKRPDGNLFGVINQLRIWLSQIIITGGLIAGYFYFINTEQFIQNPRPQAGPQIGWNPVTHSATIIFLMIQIPFTFYIIFVYISKPWKARIYRNYVLFILILANLAQSIALFFITPELAPIFFIVPISIQTSIICLAIISVATLIAYIINGFLDIVEFSDS